MSDFLDKTLDRILNPGPEPYKRPVQNLIDIDIYKPIMGAYIFRYHPDVRVRFALINRDRSIPLARIVDEDELRDTLDFMCRLKMRRTDVYYMRGMDIYGKHMFDEAFLDAYAGLTLPAYELHRNGDQYEITVEAEWSRVTHWETLLLAAIMDLYYRSLMRKMSPMEIRLLYGAAENKLYRKLLRLKSRPQLRVADFSQRRRNSFLWQKHAIEMALNTLLPGQFTGTSNTYLAAHFDQVPIGTNAHELPMVETALRMLESKLLGMDRHERDAYVRQGQYDVLDRWQVLYGNALRVMLADTYGSSQFFDGMSETMARRVAHEWRGQRQDSGDPIEECEKFIAWLKAHGVADPFREGKVNIFSDGLDVKIEGCGPVSSEPDIVELYDRFQGRILTPFGWGTNFGNDFRGCHPTPEKIVPGLEDLGLTFADVYKGFSLVCKVAAVSTADGTIGAVKLSNNWNKATGPRDQVEIYRNEVFGAAGIGRFDVTV